MLAFWVTAINHAYNYSNANGNIPWRYPDSEKQSRKTYKYLMHSLKFAPLLLFERVSDPF